MTRLTDDGYLEIGAEPRDDGDAVVLTCFLGEDVECPVGQWGELFSVNKDGVELTGEGHVSAFAYPIRIPASTVAEVMGFTLTQDSEFVASEIATAVLIKAVGDWSELQSWLRAHTEDS